MISVSIQKQLDGAGGKFDLDFDLQLEQGSIVAIMGPSGAGKSSILRMLAGILQPDKGMIKLGDNLWFDHQQKINLPPQKRDVGLVFQNLALFPHMSIIDQIRYAQSSSSDAEIEELLSLMDLSSLRSKKPASLSGGQQQRVALARSIIQSPQLLLLDEPLSALDYDMKDQMRSYIKKVHHQYGMTIFLVSHDRQDVLDLCDYAFYLVDGKITRQGKPGELSEIQKVSAIGIVTHKQEEEDYTLLTIECDGHLSTLKLTDADHIIVGDMISLSTIND